MGYGRYGMGGKLSRRLQRGLLTPTSSLRLVGQLTSAAAGCGNKGYAGGDRGRGERGREERDGRRETGGESKGEKRQRRKERDRN